MADPLKPTDPEADPVTWRRYGLIALLALVAVLLVSQFLGGNRQTDVIPGTPIAAPENANPSAP
jgi:hypothetical protein